MSRKKLPKGWSAVPLGDIIALEYGKSFPEKRRQPGPYAVYGSNGIVGRAHDYIVEERTIIVGRKGSAGEINYSEPKSWPIDTTYYVQIKNYQFSCLDFVYYLLKWLDPRRFIDTTTKPGLNRDRVYEQVIPLPPLPVQERIVQILQKADEIRRKRQEALELADKMLPALFLEMFGDPATNPKGWPIVRLQDVLERCESGIWGRRAANTGTGFFVLRSTNMPLDGRIDYTDVALIEVPREKVERYALEDGDILLNRSSGSREHIGKVSLFREPPGECGPFLFSNFVQRLRPKRASCTSEYLFFLLRSDFARNNLEKVHATSSGLRNLQMGEYLAQAVPVPPISLQRYFSRVVVSFEEARARRLEALQGSELMFRAMLSQAFTGELTAEWEAANAEEIARQTSLHERLPRLLVLALLAEKARRASRAAADLPAAAAAQAGVLVTALMKYAFLLQMEGNGGRRLYRFVPYHYGPFAKELYADLEKLQEEGLVTVDNDSEEDKTRIALADPERAEQALAELPDDLKEDAAAIIDRYGNLDHNALLRTVYEKYPAYAKKSRLRGGRKKAGGRKTTKRRTRK